MVLCEWKGVSLVLSGCGFVCVSVLMCVSVVDQSADKLSLLVCDAAQEGRASGAEGGVERDPRSQTLGPTTWCVCEGECVSGCVSV